MSLKALRSAVRTAVGIKKKSKLEQTSDREDKISDREEQILPQSDTNGSNIREKLKPDDYTIGDKQYSFVGGIEASQSNSILNEITDGVTGGYLLKKGRGRYLAMVKPWSLRYMTVYTRDGVLKYYDEPKDIIKQRNPKGQLYITGAVLAEAQERDFCFSITITKTNGEIETLMLAALDANQLASWLKVLHLAIGNTETTLLHVECGSCNHEEQVEVPASVLLTGGDLKYKCTNCVSQQLLQLPPQQQQEQQHQEEASVVQRPIARSPMRITLEPNAVDVSGDDVHTVSELNDPSKSSFCNEQWENPPKEYLQTEVSSAPSSREEKDGIVDDDDDDDDDFNYLDYNVEYDSDEAEKPEDPMDACSAAQLLILDKEQLIQRVERMEKEEIVDLLIALRNRPARSRFSSFEFETDESPSDFPLAPQAVSQTQSERVVEENSDTAAADYQSLARLSVRLLRTMCGRTTDYTPKDKHGMILHVLSTAKTVKQDRLSTSANDSFDLSNLAKSQATIPTIAVRNTTDATKIKSSSGNKIAKAQQRETDRFISSISEVIQDSESVVSSSAGRSGKYAAGISFMSSRLTAESSGIELLPPPNDDSFEIQKKGDTQQISRAIAHISAAEEREVSTFRIRPHRSPSRAASAPTSSFAAGLLPSRSPQLKGHLPNIGGVTGKRQPISPSPFFYEKSLDIRDLPRSTLEFQSYARLSKLSDLKLQQALTNLGLAEYTFRSPHEAKMAVVSRGSYTRARTPLSEDWRRRRETQSVSLQKRRGQSDTSSLSSENSEKIRSFRMKRSNSNSSEGKPKHQNRNNDDSSSNNSMLSENQHESKPSRCPGFFFQNKLTAAELPTKTREFIEYGKLSKTSAIAVSRELQKYCLGSFKFRNKHESIMAIISKKVNNEGKQQGRSISLGADEAMKSKQRSAAKFQKILDGEARDSGDSSRVILSKLSRSRMKSLTLALLANGDPQQSSGHQKNNLNYSSAFRAEECKDKFFFTSKLTEALPGNVKHNVEYGRFARCSSLAIDIELEKNNISKFKYRNTHEKIMAIISVKFNSISDVRSCGVGVAARAPVDSSLPEAGVGLVEKKNRASCHDSFSVPSSTSSSLANKRKELLCASVSEIATRLRMMNMSPEKFAYNKSMMVNALLSNEQSRIASLFDKKRRVLNAPAGLPDNSLLEQEEVLQLTNPSRNWESPREEDVAAASTFDSLTKRAPLFDPSRRERPKPFYPGLRQQQFSEWGQEPQAGVDQERDEQLLYILEGNARL